MKFHERKFYLCPKGIRFIITNIITIYIFTNIYIKCHALRENLIYILVVMIEWCVIFII